MRLFISSSNATAFKGVLLAIAIIMILELGAFLLRTDIQPFRSNFVAMSYMQQDSYTKLTTEIKLFNAAKLNSRFIQVGDSSGYHAVMPKEVMKSIGNNNLYINLNCCADMGYKGHRMLAQYALEHMRSVKYLVFYVTPFASSSKFNNVNGELADQIKQYLLDPWNALMPPSLAFRMHAINLLFYDHFTGGVQGNPLNAKLDIPQSFIQTYTNQFLQNYGWWARPSNMKALPYAYSGPCDLHMHFEEWAPGDTKSKDMLEELSRVAVLARSHHVTMILAFNPVSCSRSDNPETIELEQRIETFKHHNPDVWVPFPFIRTLPIDVFVDSFHVTPEGSKIISQQLGKYLASKLKDESTKF